mmetsp:Transcript_37586/g.88931  ORF Transcript_37586/g.88931 Transcript_37586/m.88931 type:complete len:257 (-) Transcript_37586:1271-2041(-)
MEPVLTGPKRTEQVLRACLSGGSVGLELGAHLLGHLVLVVLLQRRDEDADHLIIRLRTHARHHAEGRLPLAVIPARLHHRAVGRCAQPGLPLRLHLLEQFEDGVEPPGARERGQHVVVRHGIRLQPLGLHALQKAKCAPPLARRIACMDGRGVGDEVWRHPRLLHIPKHLKGTRPLSPELEGIDEGRVGDHVRLDPPGDHLLQKALGRLPLSGLATRAHSRRVEDDIRRQPLALHALHEAERGLGLPDLLARADRR